MQERDFIEIAERILKVIAEKSDLDEATKEELASKICKLTINHQFKSPELYYESWRELAAILNQNCNPTQSKWATEIMVIFNNLPCTIDECWEEMRADKHE